MSESRLWAISLRQPWAEAVTAGLRRRDNGDFLCWKGVENRTWWRRYQGPVLIHAAKTYDAEGARWIEEHFPQAYVPTRRDFEQTGHLGAIVGGVNVLGWTRERGVLHVDDQPWFFGPCAFVLTNPYFLPTPHVAPVPGMPGIFPVRQGKLSDAAWEGLWLLWIRLADDGWQRPAERMPHHFIPEGGAP